MSEFIDKLLISYKEVYPADDVDKVTRQFKNNKIRKKPFFGMQKPEYIMNKALQQSDYENKFTNHPLTLLSSFLGLPNRDLDDKGQSFKNLGKNLIGWRAKNNILLNIGSLVFNLAMVPPITLLNIIKIPTELLPMIGAAGAHIFEGEASGKIEDPKSKGLGLGLARLQYGFAMFTKRVFIEWKSVGSFITSPIRSLRRSHRDAQRNFTNYEIDTGEKSSSAKKILNKLKSVGANKPSTVVKTAMVIATLPITSPIIALSLLTEIASVRNKKPTHTMDSEAKKLAENHNIHKVDRDEDEEDLKDDDKSNHKLTR